MTAAATTNKTGFTATKNAGFAPSVAVSPYNHQPYVAVVSNSVVYVYTYNQNTSTWLNVGSAFNGVNIYGNSLAFNPATMQPYLATLTTSNNLAGVMYFNSKGY